MQGSLQETLVEEMILKMIREMMIREIQEEILTEIPEDTHEIIQEDTQETSVIMEGFQAVILEGISLIMETQEVILEVAMDTQCMITTIQLTLNLELFIKELHYL